MRCVVQRVSCARVSVERTTVGRIDKGLCVLVGVGQDDNDQYVEYMASKLAGLRVFEDTAGKMNLDLRGVGGELLLISQFTLFGDVRRGNRPSFTTASAPAPARQLYEALASTLRTKHGLRVATGQVQAHMRVEVGTDGPVTILIDSKRLF